MFKAEAALIPTSTALKYPALKLRSLVKRWKEELAKRRFRRATITERAKALQGVLEHVARDVVKLPTKVHDDAAEYLGRNRSHTQGPVICLSKYGIIKKIGKGRKSRQAIHIGKGRGLAYRICTGAAERQRSLHKLELLVTASPIFAALVSNPPTTADEYRKRAEESEAILMKVKAPMFSGTRGKDKKTPYSVAWALRGAACLGLATQGKTLRRTGAVGYLVNAFPDGGGWMKRLARHVFPGQSETSALARPVNKYFNLLKYTGKVEHFSMWMCFFANHSLDRVPPGLAKTRAGKLEKLMTSLRRKSGMWPTPMKLVDEAVKAGGLPA